ncbi:MAG: kinase [Nitrospinaceae bacterium]|jgi:uncharacterized protein involved in propanediol utilization|nr:kinase [Nitrospinaceae bacterium]MBT3432923.1 kinase [Nitrospinaceae bacterium]MBT3822556.1 kinase [Nitrospinaceae bacterium]MBT4093421.1 kinase [Nitrospinaceae bacterium]MBT4431611.1 kinase [Nitrospinaceae bacterium]
MNFGYGFAPAHHGEMLQGVFRSSGGSFRQGLISLPCDLFWSETFFLSDSSGVVRVQPANKWKSRRAAEIALAYLGKRSAGGRLFISSRVPEKLGLGSSSSDVVAAVRAVASSFKIRLSPEEISRISIQAEIASDPLAWGRRFLHFAQREGRVIDEMPSPIPAFEIVGFNADPMGGGVDTLGLAPPAHTDAEVRLFDDLLGQFRRGIEKQDIEAIATVATQSAKLNQRFMKLNGFELLEDMVHRIGALGLQIAHSGTVVGFLFPPNMAIDQNLKRYLAILRDELGVDGFWHFRAGGAFTAAELS